MGMPFKGRYARFHKLQKERMGGRPDDRAPCDEMERGDGLAMLIAALIILGFTYFVSVVRKSSFLHGFREMLTISFSVALISCLMGWGARAWLQIDI